MKKLLALLFTILSTLTSPASAQAFPNRPVRIITPYAAGGGVDLLTRTVAQGWDIASSNAQQFEDFLKVELPKLAQSARSAKVKAD